MLYQESSLIDELKVNVATDTLLPSNKDMEINWVILGWLIDMLLNGFVWLVIAAIFLTLIDLTDTWTRKALKLMDKADIWIRKFVENLFEWVQKKNLKIIASIVLLIILGILAQLEIIPKLIT